jgi:hypothetical protein
MTSLATRAAALAVAFGLTTCSGKTERGIPSEGAPADKPAVGPAQVEPAKGSPAQPEVAKQPARHLLMVVELEPATHAARTLTARSVDLPLPRRRGRVEQEPWRVEVLGATGSVLYSAPLKDASELRGEFPDAQGKLSGVTVKQAVAAVTLRLPLLKDATTVRVMSSAGPSGETELGRVAYPQVTP